MTTTCRFEAAAAGVPIGAVRKLAFASCYVYSPSGTDEESERSRVLRELLKGGEERFLLYYAQHARRVMDADSSLAGFLGPDRHLVPVPGSAPSHKGDRLVAERLAEALIAVGLGKCVWRGLHRVCRVRKSATALRGSRPTVADHYESFHVERELMLPSQFILVDDVVTKGRTLLAAAMRLHDALPTSDIRAFALLRTMGLGQKVSRLLAPCVGEIKWKGGDAVRTP